MQIGGDVRHDRSTLTRRQRGKWVAFHNQGLARSCDQKPDKQHEENTFLALNWAFTHLGQRGTEECPQETWQVTGSPSVPKQLGEMLKVRRDRNSFVAILCPSTKKQTVHFIQGGRHVVVYIRSSRCVNLNMGLPHRLQQRNTCPQTSPGPQGSTFQLRTPPAKRPAPLNPDICVTATITLWQHTVEFLTIKTVLELQSFWFWYQLKSSRRCSHSCKQLQRKRLKLNKRLM